MREHIRAAIARGERARRGLEMRLQRFDIRPRLAGDRRRLEAAHGAAVQAIRMRLARRGAAFEKLAAQLAQLSPLRILDRGYAIVSNEKGILKDPAEAPPGSTIQVRLAKGELEAAVARRQRSRG